MVVATTVWFIFVRARVSLQRVEPKARKDSVREHPCVLLAWMLAQSQ